MQYKVITASGAATNARAEMTGYSVSAGGSACIVNFREGGASGNILFQVKVAANDSKDNIFSFGVPFNDYIYVEFSSGTPANCVVYWD